MSKTSKNNNSQSNNTNNKLKWLLRKNMPFFVFVFFMASLLITLVGLKYLEK